MQTETKPATRAIPRVLRNGEIIAVQDVEPFDLFIEFEAPDGGKPLLFRVNARAQLLVGQPLAQARERIEKAAAKTFTTSS